jgi:hypothetical protein
MPFLTEMNQDIAKSQTEDADHDPRVKSYAKFSCLSEAGRKLGKFTTLQAPATHGLTCINDTDEITSMLFVGSGGQEQSEKKKSVITPNSQPNCF